MQSLFDACTPRSDVMADALQEHIFAARLETVAAGTAPDVYGKPDVFFDNTYPTAGLVSLQKEAIGRLTGQARDTAPILRLETSFGGGKTHSLIALYHAARGHQPPDAFLPFAVPKPGSVKVATFVGEAYDPVNGQRHDRGITTRTLWGEIAHQLGGPDGYALARESDERRAAPGYAFLNEILGERPALIMIDELPRHLRACTGISVGASNQADQTVAFVMTLLGWASSRDNVVVAYSLAGDAFAEQIEALRQAAKAQGDKQALADAEALESAAGQVSEIQRLSARQEHVITPAREDDTAEIVVHRLFERVDPTARRQIAQAYYRYLSAKVEQDGDLPTEWKQANQLERFAACYPLHPETMRLLEQRLSAHPNFQRTRGALRLVARVVRDLWQRRPEGTYAIHPYHINLGDPGIQNDLTSRLGLPRFAAVVAADVVGSVDGSPSHAQTIDTEEQGSAARGYARRLATTIFAHSLATTQSIVGLHTGEVLAATLTPWPDGGGDDPVVLKRSLEKLAQRCWYLDYDGLRYRFKTEPSPQKIVDEEMNAISTTKVKAELDQRIKGIWGAGGLLTPVHFPDTAADVEDKPGRPKLVVMHYDHLQVKADQDEPTPELLLELYDKAGVASSTRIYRNHVLFLVADAHQVETMQKQVRRSLALDAIVQDERMKQFSKEQQETLRQMREKAALEVRVAITRAYRRLYYPTASATARLAAAALPTQEQGTVQPNQANVILELLRDLDKAYRPDATIAPAYLLDKVLGKRVSMSTEEVYHAFARNPGLRILLDSNPVKDAIAGGVQQGLWGYYDSQSDTYYHKKRTVPAVEIGPHIELLLPEEAARRGLPKDEPTPGPEPGPEPGPNPLICPDCGRPLDQCVCGTATATPLLGQGAPPKAFAHLRDACADGDVDRLRAVTLQIEAANEGTLTVIRALGGAVYALDQTAVQYDRFEVLGAWEDGEQFSLVFQGSEARCRSWRTALETALSDAAEASIVMTLRYAPTGGLPTSGPFWDTFPNTLAQVGLGAMAVTVRGVAMEGAA